jgi:predicted O-methyltransferase YrrM
MLVNLPSTQILSSSFSDMGYRPSAATGDSELSVAELSALSVLLSGGGLDDAHLEIGTAAGGTLCRLMACYTPEQRPPFVVVDPLTYFPDQRSIVEQNLRGNDIDPSGVDFREGSSVDMFATAERNGDRFDFILVDGAHKIRSVIRDIRWSRLLNVNGIICFHDYLPKFKGVMWSVDRFLRRWKGHYTRIEQVDSLLMVRKTSESPAPEIGLSDILWADCWAPLLQLRRNAEKRLKRSAQLKKTESSAEQQDNSLPDSRTGQSEQELGKD